MTRFSWMLALATVAGCAGYAALVLYSASWPEAAALRQFYRWQPRAYTAAEFGTLRAGLALLAAGAAALAAGLASRPSGRAELRALGTELARAGQGLRAGWRGLRPGQRRGALLALALLTALRAYYSVVTEPYDDAVSYEVFVRARLLALSACYPMPNNHVGSNTVAWAFYHLYPGFWWSMRLPVLLAGTAGTVAWFLGLLRRSNFRVALLAVALFSSLQLSFYHSVVGRGYALLAGLSAVGFFAVLALVEAEAARRGPGRVGEPAPLAAPGAGRARAAWLALVGSGVLGLYAVPTHAYFLASAYGWLGLALLRRRAGGALLRAGALGGLTLLGAALLYAPLLLISGPAMLLHNGYVLPLPPAEFWRTLPAYVWQTEGWLAGHRWVGALPALATLAGAAWLGRRARAGRLPAGLARGVRTLAPPAAWFVLLPYGLIAAQRVHAPERTVFYKAQLLAVLVALLAEAARHYAPPARRRAGGWLLGGALGLFGASQLYLGARANHVRQADWPRYRAGVAWLSRQPVGPVLVPRAGQCMLLRFYAHAGYRARPWQLDNRPVPGVRYRYLVRRPGAPSLPGEPPPPGPPAFANEAVAIFVVP